jgi:hypothetical protein
MTAAKPVVPAPEQPAPATRIAGQDAPLLPPPGYVPVDAPCFIHAVHPDHGEDVTYVPGERLPGWVRDNLAAGALLVPEAQNVARLGPVPKGGKR